MNLRMDFNFDNAVLINFTNLTDTEREMVRNWRNNENIRKWMHSSHIISRDEHIGFIEGSRNDIKNFYWLLNDKASNHIGVVYLNRLNMVNKYAFLGLYKNPESEFDGAGLLLMQSLKRVAFDIAGLETLKLDVMNHNTRAIKFYKKTGFLEEERLDNVTIMSTRKGSGQNGGF